MPFVLALFYRRQLRLFNFTGHRPLATGYRPPFSPPTRYAQLRDKSRASAVMMASGETRLRGSR